MKRIKGVHVWFVLSMAAALALPALLLRATPDGYAACLERIEAMPQPERDRIDRNFSEFLAMNEAQRDHYRDMHRRLQADVDDAQGIYAGVFDNYTAWLRTIESGYRREELRRTTDSAQRLELMREVVDEESDREMREVMEVVGRDVRGIPFLRRWVRGRLEMVLLEQGRYETLMRSVEDRVDLTRDERRGLEGLAGINRTIRLFELLEEKGTPLSRALDNSEVSRIIQDAGLESLMESLPREYRDEAPDLDSQRRFVLMMVVLANVRKEYRIELQSRQPSEGDLRAFLNDVDDERRDDLLRSSPDDFRRQLTEAYAAEHEDLDFDVVIQGMFGRGPRADGPEGRPGPRPEDRDGPQADAGSRRDGRPEGPGPGFRGDRPPRPQDAPPPE